MNVFLIKLSGLNGDDFQIVTNLSEKQIKSVIQAMINDSLSEEIAYNSDDFIYALMYEYPRSTIVSHLYDPLIIDFSI